MMSRIVRTMAGVIVPFVLVYGVYVIMHGHLTLGGGFQGGAVFASGIALFLVAYGSHFLHRRLKERHLSILESGGALIFIGLAFAGIGTVFFYNILVGSSFFGNIPASGVNQGDIWTAGVIPLMNVGVGLKVIAGLSAILLVMALATTLMEVDE